MYSLKSIHAHLFQKRDNQENLTNIEFMFERKYRVAIAWNNIEHLY